MGKERLFTRELVVMMIIGFCYSATYLLVYISIADYAQTEFDRDATWGGLAACLFILGAFISRLFLARFVDIIGRKRCLVITSLLAFVTCAVYPLIPDYTTLCINRVLHGFFYGLGMLTVNTLVVSAIPETRRSEGLGYYMIAYTVASAIGPYISIQLMYNGGFVWIFVLAAVLNLLPVFLTYFITSEYIPPTKEQIADALKFRFSNFIERSAIGISTVCMFFYLAYSSVVVFISEYGTYTGLVWATSVFFLVFAVSSFLSRATMGRLADMHGDNIVFIPCLILLVVSFVMISFATASWMLLVPAFLLGFCVAVNNGVGQAIAVRYTSPERYSICLSTFQIFNDAANGFAPLLFGLIISLAGFRNMYLTAAVFALIALILYLAIHARRGNDTSGTVISDDRD